MTTIVATAPRIVKYTTAQAQEVVDKEIHAEDGEMSWLAAIHLDGIVSDRDINGDEVPAKLSWIDTRSIAVIETDTFPTGIYFKLGDQTIIILNTEHSILDYDLISQLHPIADAAVYIWSDDVWESNNAGDLGVYGEWYRRDVYPDDFQPFDGETLGPEDKI